jgi:hypothetical protein
MGNYLGRLLELKARAEPKRLRIRRTPQAHAMVVSPLKNGNGVVRLAPHEEQLARLIRREGQAEVLLMQPIEKEARVEDVESGLRSGG